MPEPWMTLLHTNRHERDQHITFYEPTHTYTIKGSSKGIISGTGFLHQFFPHFDAKKTIKKMMSSPKWPSSPYFGMTADQIETMWSDKGKQASEAGTAMHLAIEQFLNGREDVIEPSVKETKEYNYFLQFWKDHGEDLEPYRTEWEVWSEDHLLCGSIDMVFRRKSDGKFLIYDWKRSREIKTSNSYGKGFAPLEHLDDCNYWHYTLQLNVYRWILENLYGLEIADMFLIICHPDNKNYKRMRLNRLDKEVEDMLACRKRALDMKWPHPVLLPIPDDSKHVEEEESTKYGFLAE
jgi:ATP-dependent exoDNAse (exonuclease V) beta subunit